MLYLAMALGIWVAQDDGPAGTLLLNDGAKATRLTSVRVDLKLTSPGAGDVQMSITVEGQPQGPWVPFREVSFHDLPAGDGEKKITLRLKDGKGKESAPVTATIRLDTVPPVLKVEAPAKVQGFEARLVLESADAVALQYTENIASWSAWEPFSTPKTIALSKGAGSKQVFVRVKDEAGNESIPSRLLIEAQDPTAPAAAPGLGSLSLGLRRTVENLELTVWVYGSGLTEMKAELDEVEVLSRRPYAPSVMILIRPISGARRLVVTAWDGAGREHRAEAVFQEQDVQAIAPSNSEELSEPWRVDAMAGVLPLGVRFNSRTSLGDREIKGGALPVFRVQLGTQIIGPAYLQPAGEWTEARSLRIYSGGGDVGVRFSLGSWEETKAELRIEAGYYVSELRVHDAEFEGFRRGWMTRLGVALGAQLSENLWVELMIDGRYAIYRYAGLVLAGDQEPDPWGFGAILGFSFRF